MVTCPHCGVENPEGFRFCGSCGRTLEPARTREERKVVTVLFADLVGFTGKAEQLDPEDVRAMLSPYYAQLRGEIERHGGTVEKFIGDAVMALFGAPVAHEDDPERAVRAALAIRDRVLSEADETGLSLRLRIAVNTGEALIALDARTLEGEGMASGDVVNTAARLQAAAPVNGILVGDGTYRATNDVIDYREAAPVDAKGKTELITVWEAVAARSRFGDDVEQGGRTRLVGRTRELASLVEALARTRRELTPQLITLVGVPGVGKSRLVAELFEVVEQDPDLIWWRQGRSLPYGENLSFWALGQIVKAHAGILETDPVEVATAKLDAMVSELITDADDPAWIDSHLRPLVGLAVDAGWNDRRGEAFAAWRRFLEALADRRPLVLVFEDLHWADDGLLDFVDHLADWATGVPMLIVCTARPELLDRRPGWGGGKRNASTISIASLSREETAQLLSALLEQALLPAELQEQVLTLAEGNPLFAEEYVRMLQYRGFLTHDEHGWHLAEQRELPLPETVQGMIAARLDALPAPEKELIQHAAVIGKVFWPGGLAAAGATANLDDALHGLERKEFIRRERRSAVAGEPQYAFLHALVRDVAYGQIPRAGRVGRHRLAAEWIESLASDRTEDRAEMLVHHYLEAIALARSAGIDLEPLREPAVAALIEAAERAGALYNWTAVAEFAAAALELLPADDSHRARLLLAQGRAGWLLGRPAAVESLLEASEAFERQGDPESAAEAELILSRFYWLRGERESADRRTAYALALVADRPATPTQARVLAWRARDLFLQGDQRAGLELAQRTLPVATEVGEDDVMSHVLNTIGSTRVLLGDPGGLDDLRRSADFARSARSPENLHNALNNLANMYWRVGRLDVASATLAEAREANELYGYAAGLRWLAGEDMLDQYLRGDWNRALQTAEELLAFGAGRHYQDTPALTIRAEVLLARGDLEQPLADSERALELARQAADEQLVAPALIGRASVLGAARRRAEADVLLEEALREHDLLDAMGYQLPLMLAELGRGDEFLAALGDDAPATPWADAARAVAGGDFGRGAEIYAEIGAQAPAAWARLMNAEVLVRSGRRAEADVELKQALAYFRSVGATASTRRSEALLAATA